MPTAGRDFGVDSDRQLQNLPWAAIIAWRPAIPANPANAAIPNGLPASPVVFAGRYFSPWAGNRWADGEHVGPGNPHLAYVVPVQGPEFNVNTHEQTLRVQGRDVHNHVRPKEVVIGWGAADAKNTCKRIVRAVDRGELNYPFFKAVIVYLDIEPGVNLSPNYWYGWASSVYWYCTGAFHLPFHPGLYCSTMHNPEDHGPDATLHQIPTGPLGGLGDVQTGLTAAPNNLASRCYGVWADNQFNNTGFNNPAFPMVSRYAVNFRPDWENRFDTWKQTVHFLFGLIPWKTGVPVRLWQYATASTDPAHPTPAAFNALHVDLNEKSPDCECLAWTLKVP